MPSESDAKSHKDSILKQLARYQSHYVADACLSYLNFNVEPGPDAASRQPWLPLLLLKWVYESGEFQDVFRLPPSDRDFRWMLQKIQDLQSYQLPSAYTHQTQFFRSIGFQQFIYQEGFSTPDFGRQILLFSSLEAGDKLRSLFANHFGISVNAFLDLSLVLVMFVFDSHRDRFTASFLAPLFKLYSRGVIERFLGVMSGGRRELVEFLADTGNTEDPAIEQYQQSPFLRIPLIRWNQFYRIVNPSILGRFLEHSLYDLFREIDPDVFMNRFGRIFERYVQRLLEHTGVPFVSDDEIAKSLGKDRRLVDFIIRESPSCCVCVDAKAVEMAQVGKATTDTRLIYERTKSSILKGIEQGISTVQAIEERSLDGESLAPAKEYFLLIVTYKEMYLRNGREYASSVAPQAVNECYRKYPESERLPVDNIFFLSISDFEYLAEAVKQGQVELCKLLRQAREDDSGPDGSGKFMFRMHLIDEVGADLRPPPFLLDAIDPLYDRLVGSISNSVRSLQV